MDIKRVNFLKSSHHLAQVPPPTLPEYAFCGRSNVGKSSLINMLTRKKDLAKTSSMPGKTQLINHFVVDDRWFLVDLPGYGFAKVQKTKREAFHHMIREYLEARDNLGCVFALIDSRLEPQENDLEFLEFLGVKGIPFAIVFTKADKLGPNRLLENVEAYKKRLLQEWEELPPIFLTSAEEKSGRDQILDFIEEVNDMFYHPEKYAVDGPDEDDAPFSEIGEDEEDE